MNIYADPIDQLARLDAVPSVKELPHWEFAPNSTNGQLFGPAFECDETSADMYFRRLILHYLWFRHPKDPAKRTQKLTVAEAVAQAREALWFYALARDVSVDGPWKVLVDNGRVTRLWPTGSRDLVVVFYGCTDPLKDKPVVDKKELARLRAEKAARRAGVVLWTKQEAGLLADVD